MFGFPLTYFRLKLNYWSDFYQNENLLKYDMVLIYGSDSERLIYNHGNIYVKYSYFFSLISANHGGAISFISSNNEDLILIENSAFYDCFTNKTGGGIYKNSENSCVLNRVCGFNCKTSGLDSSHGAPFCNIFCSNTKGIINNIFDSQIAFCNDKEGKYVVHLYYGEHNLKGNNITNNYVKDGSAFWLYIVDDTVGKIEFCSLLNNTSYQCRLIGSYEANVTVEICNTIIAYNSQKTSTEGLIYLNCETSMRDSYFLENTSPGYFFSIIRLFHFENCTFGSNQTKDFPESSSYDVTIIDNIDPDFEDYITTILDKTRCDNEKEILQVMFSNARKSCHLTCIIKKQRNYSLFIFILTVCQINSDKYTDYILLDFVFSINNKFGTVRINFIICFYKKNCKIQGKTIFRCHLTFSFLKYVLRSLY